MAGKHSKSFLESLRENHTKSTRTPKAKKYKMAWPFKVLIALFLVVLVASSSLIAAFFVEGKMNQNVLDESARLFKFNGSEDALETLANQNNDIKGWLKISGTDVNNAVCQSDDNIYYTNHNQNNQKSRYGALFLSHNDKFNRKDDQNIVIYGNNMRDGSMFGSLKKYRNINFYKKNPIIELYYGKESENYIIFSVMLISNVKDDKGVFSPSKSFFANEEHFKKWYNEACHRSLITANIEADYKDDFLTLVTTADDFEGARFIVMAKKIDNDKVDEIDTSSAVVNSDIKYPKIWYDTKGLKYPY
ncbi:MAG: class B sortase [Clostridia bacterium]|nr:class B sortase [Clostridia bacterium]